MFISMAGMGAVLCLCARHSEVPEITPLKVLTDTRAYEPLLGRYLLVGK
jgi:hypothetical protein